jgi:hypothetical protein
MLDFLKEEMGREMGKGGMVEWWNGGMVEEWKWGKV